LNETGTATGAAADPRQTLLASPMSAFQIKAIATVVALCALDGFDVFAITFAAPSLLAEWGIGKAQLGIAISVGLIGMAAGSLFLAPLADQFGRRRMALFALVIMIMGTAWTTAADSIEILVASRLLTGFGVGAMVSIIIPMAAEFANARRRDLAVSLATIGFPLGAIIGGFVSSFLLANYGWRSIFIAATVLGIVMFIVCFRILIEPVALVVARPGTDGLARVNHFLARCGFAAVASIPPPPASQKVPVGRLFERNMAGVTIHITLIYVLIMIPIYFMQSWLPTLIADLGIVPAKAALISSFFSIGGVTSGLLVAFLSEKFGLRILINIALVGTFVMILAFSLVPPLIPALILASVIAGFFIQGSAPALYAVLARTFPADMRASGTGFVVGIGRIGSALPPLIAGALAAGGFGRTTIALVMAAPALLALVLLIRFVIRPPTTA
jgi:MFS transporter, AAHS family, 4-hydroxybenzoate transporter